MAVERNVRSYALAMASERADGKWAGLWAGTIRDKDGNPVEPEGWPESDKEHADAVVAAFAEFDATGNREPLVALGVFPANPTS